MHIKKGYIYRDHHGQIWEHPVQIEWEGKQWYALSSGDEVRLYCPNGSRNSGVSSDEDLCEEIIDNCD